MLHPENKFEASSLSIMSNKWAEEYSAWHTTTTHADTSDTTLATTARLVVSHEAHQDELSRLSAEELLSRVDLDYNKVGVDDILAMLANAATFQENLAVLQGSAPGTIGGPRNRPALQAADTAAPILDSFISELSNLVPVEHRPTTGQAAIRALDITEILEMILMQATPTTVLTATRVNGSWRAVVDRHHT